MIICAYTYDGSIGANQRVVGSQRNYDSPLIY